MKKYKIIDISTVRGLKHAERLKSKDYHFSIYGIDKLIFTVPTVEIKLINFLTKKREKTKES